MRNVVRPVAVLGILLAVSFGASCSGGSGGKANGPGVRHAICDYAMDSGKIDGRLVKLRGLAATFRVEHVHPNAAARAGRVAHPVAGHDVVVRYEKADVQYLEVGERYSVKVWPIKGYVSSVHTADRPCSGGTVHADGSAIAT